MYVLEIFLRVTLQQWNIKKQHMISFSIFISISISISILFTYYHEPTDRQTKVACCLISVHFLSLYNFTSFFIVCFIAYANYIESKFKCLWTLSNKFSTTERHNETHTFHDIHTMTRTQKKKNKRYKSIN